MPKGNDFCNNQLLNAALHIVDPGVKDDEYRIIRRGIPAVGKSLYEVRYTTNEDDELVWAGSKMLLGVDTKTPLFDDSIFDGGGAYSPVLLGDFVPFTGTISQGTPFALQPGAIGVTLMRLGMDGGTDAGRFVGEGVIRTSIIEGFTGSAGTSWIMALNGYYTIDGLDIVSSSRVRYYALTVVGRKVGTYTLKPSGSDDHISGSLIIDDIGTSSDIRFVRYDGVDHGSVYTLASGDEIELNLQGAYSGVLTEIAFPEA